LIILAGEKAQERGLFDLLRLLSYTRLVAYQDENDGLVVATLVAGASVVTIEIVTTIHPNQMDGLLGFMSGG
jgi:hypothetical protein